MALMSPPSLLSGDWQRPDPGWFASKQCPLPPTPFWEIPWTACFEGKPRKEKSMGSSPRPLCPPTRIHFLWPTCAFPPWTPPLYAPRWPVDPNISQDFHTSATRWPRAGQFPAALVRTPKLIKRLNYTTSGTIGGQDATVCGAGL